MCTVVYARNGEPDMKKRFLTIASFAAVLAVCLMLGPAVGTSAADAVSITIDDEEYNLYTDNFPDPIGDDVYAKFTSSVSDVDDYYLYFDQDVAEESFKTALDKNNIDYDEDFICYMKTFLYKYSDEGDDVSVTSSKLEIYFPLPLDAQEHPDDCAFYKLSSGKLTQVYPLQLYNIDDVYYIRMTMTSSTDYSAIYGFVYNDPESYAEDDSDSDDYEDEDEDDPDDYGDGTEEDDEDEPTPTPKPSPTPTPVIAATATPTPVQTVTATPTPSSGSGNGTGNNSGNNSGKKDSTPKTGDDFPLGLTLTGLFLSAAAVVFAVTKFRKR